MAIGSWQLAIGNDTTAVRRDHRLSGRWFSFLTSNPKSQIQNQKPPGGGLDIDSAGSYHAGLSYEVE